MKALIIGSGVSGRSAYDFLKKQNINVEFAKRELIESEFISDEILDRLFDGLSFIVVSPGISLDIYLIKEAKKKKIKIIGELELGARCVEGNIISVTGTNGKTTTVSLINHLLRGYEKNVFLGGNIGVPITSFCDKTNQGDIVVLECSSFQLESVKKFHSHISAILNITEDHLNRHKTMQNYMLCKYNITKNQRECDFLLLNADDEILMKNPPKTKAKIFYFSTKNKVFGCYAKNGSIYFNDNLTQKKLVSLKDIKLVGEHNLSNIACAVLAVYLQTKNTKLFENLKTFCGVPHRLEYVASANKIAFFNDSKATNIDSTLVALKSFKCGINLILGGSDKGYDFDKLFIKIPKNVKNIAVFGQTKNKIAFFAEKYNFKNLYICDCLRSATHLCYNLAKPNEIVLLSPACASFDCFLNFEERGNIFKKIVKEIQQNEDILFETKTKNQT